MAVIKHQIPIKAARDQVYDAIATEQGLRSWWTADSTSAERVGGKAEFGFDRRGMVFRMNIEELRPGEKVIWRCSGDHPEWAGTRLTCKIANESGISVLRFTHSGWKGQRVLRDLQFYLGQTYVSPQRLCGGQESPDRIGNNDNGSLPNSS